MSNLTSCNSKISEIIYILKEESKLLKQGKFAEIERILVQKNKALADFEREVKTLDSTENLEHVAPQIEQLQRIANENGILLKAVFHGVKAAQARLDSLNTQDAQLGAYGRTGDSLVLTENNNSAEKRV